MPDDRFVLRRKWLVHCNLVTNLACERAIPLYSALSVDHSFSPSGKKAWATPAEPVARWHLRSCQAADQTKQSVW
ncbi:Uncharacterised protein [Vibrio cholerae]|nr:Uncharacterised protein [Vibrio cholerae]